MLLVVFISLCHSNRLHSIVDWILSTAVNGAVDGSNKSHKEHRDHQNHQIGMRVIAVVLKLELRDRVSLMERLGLSDGEYIESRGRLSALSTGVDGLDTRKQSKWIEDAIDAETQLVRFFLCHLREKYPQRNW